MSDASGTTSWGYDARGQMIAETRAINGAGSFLTQLGYNSAGGLAWMTYPGGNNRQVGERVDYAYHRQGSLDSVLSSFSQTLVQSTDYDEAGRITQRTLGYNNPPSSGHSIQLLPVGAGYPGRAAAVDAERHFLRRGCVPKPGLHVQISQGKRW